LKSPLGIPAGPLINSNYVSLYAGLGFDIPVYKTLRTIEKKAHPAPNCLMVDNTRQLEPNDLNQTIHTLNDKAYKLDDIAITNSFGMPSKPVAIWQQDIAKANQSLQNGQLMIVSCVGSPEAPRDIITDYVYCAQLAVEAGAKAIELNYSCPNVTSKEGSIFHDPDLSSQISKAVKKAIGTIPLMIKIGYIHQNNKLLSVIDANAPYIDGIAAINTIPMQVINAQQKQALPGQGRLKSGICGRIIRDLSLNTIARMHQIRMQYHYNITLCGVGGITRLNDFNAYLNQGADIVMSATGAMWDPWLAYKWKLNQG
jgi:dihydroorotate dehydrogenase